MINADIVFIVFIIMFGAIGAIRGWVREVLVTFSMIFALFVVNQFGKELGSLAGTAKSLELEVGGLIEQMQLSIAEADRFIAEMKGGAGG